MRRNWAKRVKDYTGMMQLSCDIKPNRSVSDVFINQKMDVTELMKYLDKKKKKGEKITFFHAIVTGVGKVYHNRPLLNRFVQDRHLFEHNDVSIAFVAKTEFNDRAEELMICQKIEPKDNIFTISKKLTEKLGKIRNKEGKVEVTGANNIIDVLGHWPNIFRVPVFGFLKWMDKKGLLPASLEADNIYYSSIILSNLGRLHSGAIFHNITDFGNSSALGTIGEVRDEEVIIDGKKQVRKLCEFGINLDERIADGYYFVKSIQLLQYIFDHPEMLEDDADDKIETELR
jgi:pyruvate/2-oxoglutarate dehydrogenase complex dihydrolipoamide acyltransferase (E2) component